MSWEKIDFGFRIGLQFAALVIGISIGSFAFNYFTQETIELDYTQGLLEGINVSNCTTAELLDYIFESETPPTLEEFKQVKKDCWEQNVSVEWTDGAYNEEQYDQVVEIYWG